MYALGWKQIQETEMITNPYMTLYSLNLCTKNAMLMPLQSAVACKSLAPKQKLKRLLNPNHDVHLDLLSICMHILLGWRIFASAPRTASGAANPVTIRCGVILVELL